MRNTRSFFLFSRTLWLVGIAAMVMLSATSAIPAEEDPKTKEEAPKRRPLVVMKQTQITGKVFFLAEEENEEEAAAELRIEVWTLDGKKRLYKTTTDKAGAYILPSLEVARYRLILGRLQLELKVEEPASTEEESLKIPKIILVFIPRALG